MLTQLLAEEEATAAEASGRGERHLLLAGRLPAGGAGATGELAEAGSGGRRGTYLLLNAHLPEELARREPRQGDPHRLAEQKRRRRAAELEPRL